MRKLKAVLHSHKRSHDEDTKQDRPFHDPEDLDSSNGPTTGEQSSSHAETNGVRHNENSTKHTGNSHVPTNSSSPSQSTIADASARDPQKSVKSSLHTIHEPNEASVPHPTRAAPTTHRTDAQVQTEGIYVPTSVLKRRQKLLEMQNKEAAEISKDIPNGQPNGGLAEEGKGDNVEESYKSAKDKNVASGIDTTVETEQTTSHAPG